jgi:hypothetical protein
MNKPMKERKWKLKAKEILSGEYKSSNKIPRILTITKNSIIYREYFN